MTIIIIIYPKNLERSRLKPFAIPGTGKTINMRWDKQLEKPTAATHKRAPAPPPKPASAAAVSTRSVTGLTGQVVVLLRPRKSKPITSLPPPIAEGLETVGALEIQLAWMYTGFLWRINRAASVEDNMFGLGHMEQVAENLNIDHPEAHNAATHAKTFRNEYKAFDRIGIYTQRLVNNANKILKQLKDVQAERRRREQGGDGRSRAPLSSSTACRNSPSIPPKMASIFQSTRSSSTSFAKT